VNVYVAPFMRKPVRKFLYIARRDIAEALYMFLKDAEEAEAHAEALANGLIRGDFDKRFALTALALRLALREQGYSEDFITQELRRIRVDILIMLKPYMEFLKH